MKIVSSDASRIVAVDKAYAQLFAAIVMIIIGITVGGISLAVSQLIGSLVALAVFVGGVLFLVFRMQRTLIIDKTAGQVTFSLKSVVKKGDYQYAIGDVSKVEFTTQYVTTATGNSGPTNRPGISFGTMGAGSIGGSTETTQRTQLHLVLKTGEIIDLADGQRSMSNMGVFSSVPNLSVGQTIAQFIGVPFEQAGPASLDQTVSAIRDAIIKPAAPATLVMPAPVQSAPAAAIPAPQPAAPAPTVTSEPVQPNRQ